jgi:hypothetical protein
MADGARCRRLFIVLPDDTATFESLSRILSGDDSARVIYDRRLPVRRPRSGAWSTARVQARVLGDRRRHPEIDEALRTRGWACVDLEPEPGPRPARGRTP